MMRRAVRSFWLRCAVAGLLILCGNCKRSSSQAGSASGRLAGPFNLPADRHSPVPELLSQVGVFTDLPSTTPHPDLLAYDVNVSFWSDGADKRRWIWAPPGEKIRFSAGGEWSFPERTVFVKHFDMPVDEARPDLKRRLETRFLIREPGGGVFGFGYKWRTDGSDADLIVTGSLEDIPVKNSRGEASARKWYFPRAEDCLQCHTPLAGHVLGVSTRQLNGDHTSAGGIAQNQILAWDAKSMFEPRPDPTAIASYPRLAGMHDRSRSVEDRARSYLDANCAYCHRPDGAPGHFDARYETPLAGQNLIDGPVLIDLGVDHALAIAPGDAGRSLILQRINTLKLTKMPPLARVSIDSEGVALLQQWIDSLPTSLNR